MFCNSMENVVVETLVVGELLECGKDVHIGGEFLRNDLIQADILVLMDHQVVRFFLFKERGLVIRVSVHIFEIFQCGVGGTWCILHAMHDFVETICDELFARQHIGEQVLDGQAARHAVDRHAAREADLIKQQLEFIALTLDAFEK